MISLFNSLIPHTKIPQPILLVHPSLFRENSPSNWCIEKLSYFPPTPPSSTKLIQSPGTKINIFYPLLFPISSPILAPTTSILMVMRPAPPPPTVPLGSFTAVSLLSHPESLPIKPSPPTKTHEQHTPITLSTTEYITQKPTAHPQPPTPLHFLTLDEHDEACVPFDDALRGHYYSPHGDSSSHP